MDVVLTLTTLTFVLAKLTLFVQSVNIIRTKLSTFLHFASVVVVLHKVLYEERRKLAS